MVRHSWRSPLQRRRCCDARLGAYALAAARHLFGARAIARRTVSYLSRPIENLNIAHPRPAHERISARVAPLSPMHRLIGCFGWSVTGRRIAPKLPFVEEFRPMPIQRSLHPEIEDDGDAQEKGDAFLKSYGRHGIPPMKYQRWPDARRRAAGNRRRRHILQTPNAGPRARTMKTYSHPTVSTSARLT
jgi:hypothetical protein